MPANESNPPVNINGIKELLHDSNFYYIVCVGNDSNYMYINNYYASRFHYIAENLIGKPYYITMHPDDTKVCEEVGALCYQYPGKLFPAVIRKHDNKGGYIFTQWEYLLIIENDVPQGIFCLGYDTTEHEIAKKNVEKINQDLAEKNTLLNNIAYEQSHIVRAPLANILGLVSILKTYRHDDYIQSIIDMLEESSNKLDDIIKSIIRKTYS
jgi:hypothetical protein